MAVGARIAAFGGVIVVLMAAGIVVTLVTRAAPAETAGPIRISAGVDDCGAGWSHPAGGRTLFAVSNETVAGMEVLLEDPRTHGVYLDLEGFGAGATVTRSIALADGRYRFACLPADGTVAYGPVVEIRGAGRVADAAPALVPLTADDLIAPAQAYRAWVAGRLPMLERDAVALDAAVRAGDVPSAKRAWLAAQTEYASLGAAYGAFGEHDAAIDGAPASGTTALGDPGLEGLRKIEALLWSGAPSAAIAPHSAALVAAVRSLEQAFPAMRMEPAEIGLRAHEILEDALQSTLTGADDAGSGTSLAILDADLLGTHEALAPLHDLLVPRYPQLAAAERQITATKTLIETHRSADGSWTPLDALSTEDRQRVNASVDRTLELLAPVAAICDPRRLS